MSFFNNIGRTTTAIANVVVNTAEAVSTSASAGKISAEVLVIKAKSLKEEAAIEAKVTMYNNMKKIQEFKNTVTEDTETLAQMEKDFKDIMEEYSNVN